MSRQISRLPLAQNKVVFTHLKTKHLNKQLNIFHNGPLHTINKINPHLVVVKELARLEKKERETSQKWLIKGQRLFKVIRMYKKEKGCRVEVEQ